MISVVVSTRKIDPEYRKHIQDTCGVKDIDILMYENPGTHSLTELYNIGLRECLHDVVVFIHDDLAFEKGSKWGQKILNHFTNSDYGILGKAGTTHMTETGVWWQEQTKMVGRVYHMGEHPKTGKPGKWLSEYSGNFPDEIIPVAAVDGLFIAVQKHRIKKEFNEDIKGFHFYDIDFSIANRIEGVNIGVVFDFPITHKSVGKLSPEWEAGRNQFVNLHNGKLPLSVPVNVFVDKKDIKVKKQPLVSIIIPTKNNHKLISQLLDSIHTVTNYENFEVVIADTGSDPDELKLIKDIVGGYQFLLNHGPHRGMNVRVVEYDYYNFAKINNDVVKNHINPKTELLLFCNNDIYWMNDCISHMVNVWQKNRHTCGTVGARLHYQDGTIQHAGIFVCKPPQYNMFFGHLGQHSGYQYSINTIPVLGNTAALLMVSKTMFNAVGGFNENYRVCFEDVELNLAMLTRNYKNYFCSDAVAYHLESQTRGKSVDQEDIQRIYEYTNKVFHKISKYVI